MRRAGDGRVIPRATQLLRTVALGGVLVVALAGCGAGEAEPTAVPTFPLSAQQGGPSTGPDDESGVIPDDCARILGAPDLEAVLGLPLGSVGLRTVIGVAEPSVGRTERVSCAYKRTGGPTRSILDINATAYRDPEAAMAQWRVNVEAESGERRDVPLGSAAAVLFEQGDETVLMVAHATSNLTLVLPEQPLPGGRNRADVLVDLALRVLPAVSAEPTSGPPPPGTAQPAAQAGGAR